MSSLRFPVSRGGRSNGSSAHSGVCDEIPRIFQPAIVNSMRFIIPLSFVSLLILLNGTAKAIGPEVAMLTLAQRNAAEGDPKITSVGMFSTQQGTSLHLDLLHFDEAGRKDSWSTELGMGYLLPTQIPLFIGGGVIAGYHRSNKDYFATWYPEVGVVVPLIPGVAVSASRKRYQRFHQEAVDVLMFGIALTMK